MEEINIKNLRYEIDSENYLTKASFGCMLGDCQEYTGEVPDGYETMQEWYKKNCECVKSWKIVDGNLVYDASRDYKLKIIYDQQNNENSHVTRKELGISSTEEINPYTDLFPSHQSSGGYIVSVNETFNRVGNLPTEEVNLSLHKEQDLDLIELEFIGNNFLPNTATSSTNNGIDYTQNKDKTIKISGTATDRSTLNLAGTDTSVRNILTFKGNHNVYDDGGNIVSRPTNYLLFGLADGVSLEFYKYDGSDRTLVGTYRGGVISFEEDTNITQVVLVVDKGITIDTTIKPMLQLVGLEYPILPMKKYTGDDEKKGQYYVDGVSTQETRSGKNLLPISATTTTTNGVKFTVNSDGSVHISGTSTARTLFNINVTKPITLKNNTSYTLSKKGDSQYVEVYLRKASISELIASMAGTNTHKKFTNSYIEPIFAYIAIPTNTTLDITIYLQLEEGTTPTEWEQYGISPSPDYPSEIINIYKAGTYNVVANNKIYEITLEDDLRSVPSGVADRLWFDIDGDNGIDIERRIGSVVLDGSESWYVYPDKTNTFAFAIGQIIGKQGRGYCTHFNTGISSTKFDVENGVYDVYTSSLIISYLECSSVDEFKTWLSTHNTEVYYELENYTTSYISGYTYSEYEYEEYKNNTTLIDLAGNEFTIADDIYIKNNQIILVKNNGEEIYLGDTVMPRTYTPYTHAYCHQKVYIDFKYKDPRNVDITKINLKGLISITNIETEYNFTSDDLIKAQNYIMETGTLTDEEIELYDINGDGAITSYDYVMIKRMIEGTIPNKIIGTLEINSTKSQRTIVLRDKDGKIKTSLGLNGVTTPSLTLDGGKVYGEFVLFNGDSNEDITLKNDASNYDYIEIFYCDNNKRYYGSQKIYSPNNKTTTLSLTPFFSNANGLYSYIYNGGISIIGDTITRTGSMYLQIQNQSIVNHTTDNYIYIYRVVGYRDGGVVETEQPIEPEEPTIPDTPIEVDNTKTISANGSKGYHKFTLEVNEESLVGTKSILNYSFKLSAIQTGWDWANWNDASRTVSYVITIGNETYNGTIPAYDGSSTVTLKSGSNIEIEHDADGTKTIPISFTITDTTGASFTSGNASASGEMVLTTI